MTSLSPYSKTVTSVTGSVVTVATAAVGMFSLLPSDLEWVAWTMTGLLTVIRVATDFQVYMAHNEPALQSTADFWSSVLSDVKTGIEEIKSEVSAAPGRVASAVVRAAPPAPLPASPLSTVYVAAGAGAGGGGGAASTTFGSAGTHAWPSGAASAAQTASSATSPGDPEDIVRSATSAVETTVQTAPPGETPEQLGEALAGAAGSAFASVADVLAANRVQ